MQIFRFIRRKILLVVVCWSGWPYAAEAVPPLLIRSMKTDRWGSICSSPNMYTHSDCLISFHTDIRTVFGTHNCQLELYELVSINRVQLFFMLLLLLHKVLWYLFFQSGLFLDICPGSHSVCIHTELISKSDSERQKMGYSQ